MLYLILDCTNKSKRSLKNICSKCEVDLIQLRDKVHPKSEVLNFACVLSKYLVASKTLFIINDYVDVAKSCNADGVHLGQTDTSIKKARTILGKNKIIGISCHSVSQALKAQKEGADYIGIGPVFATPTKPEYKAIGLKILSQLKGKIKIPYFAIGDISKENVEDVIASGASRIAVARAILKSNHPKEVANRLNKLLRAQ